MRYEVTVPSGLSQVMRMEVESMSEKMRSFGRSIAAGEVLEQEGFEDETDTDGKAGATALAGF